MPLMSISALGRITSSFMRSRVVVPPAMNWASAEVGGPSRPDAPAKAWATAAALSART
jgi:hypothetical protein